MSEHRDRANKSTLENSQMVDTVKALIEIYKSAFGREWEQAFRETVTLSLG
jgi:hypothetical protein